MGSSFRSYTLDGKRFGPDTNNKGRMVPGTETPFIFTASVQPLRGHELETLPENQRDRESYRLYTDFQLQTVDTTNKLRPDRIQLFNKTFEVIRIDIWQNNVIPHYKAIMSVVNADF